MKPKKIGEDMSDCAISTARMLHQTILQRLMTGPGDSEGAMRRAESRFGLGYWSQWNLRYKRQASQGFIAKVKQAHLALIEKSVRRDIQVLETQRGTADDADNAANLEDLIAEAETLLERIKTAKEG